MISIHGQCKVSSCSYEVSRGISSNTLFVRLYSCFFLYLHVIRPLFWSILEKNQTGKKISLNEAPGASGLSMWQRIIRYFQNSRRLFIILVIVGGGILAFGVVHNRREKRELAAQKAIWPAEAYLREKAYDLALEGGGGDMGLLEIIEKFKGTKAGNLAHFYAAVVYLEREGEDHDAALEHLKAFELEESFMQFRVWCLIGDIYCDRKEYDQALEYYHKAADHMPNKFTTPTYLFRMAFVYEELKEYEKARESYERVYTLFPKCRRVNEAIKHESRLRLLASKS